MKFFHHRTMIFILHPSSFIIYPLKKSLLGDYSGGGTPGSIPNPEVKPASADGT
jgi:hypothetical protein